MVHHERAAWSGLITTVIGLVLYWFLLIGFQSGPIVESDWLWAMLWSMGAAIGLSIVLTIVWGIVAGLKDPAGASASDIRDRDISRLGARIGYGVLIAAGLAVIVLCALHTDVFWIAQVMFLGFAVSSFAGDVARVIAYRRGLV